MILKQRGLLNESTPRHYQILLYSALLLFCQSAFSQREKIDAPAEAITLKVKFPKEEIASIQSSVSNEYFIDGATGTLMAREKNNEQYVSLKSNAALVLRTYSNSHVKTESYSVKTDKGKSQAHDKFCGNSMNEEVFYTDGQMCAYRVVLGQPGQSVVYESSTLYNDPKYLTQVFFNQEHPCKSREVNFIIPKGVDIELAEMNFAGYNIQKNVKTTDKATIYSYTLPYADAFPKESNQPGYLHFLPHLVVLCKSYVTTKGEKVMVLSSTDDLYKWYVSIISQLNTNYETLTSTVQELTRNLKTDEEKIRAIYYWVQDNIKYIAFEDGIAAFKPENAKEVFYKRYGDCKGMANLTKAMLQLAGYDARLTWIGTNKIPYSYSLPTLAVDNHMICTVMLKGKQLILDATEKQNAMGSYAERIQGKEILIENGSNYLLAKVPVESIDSYLEESSWKFNIVDLVLKGNGVSVFRGETKKNISYLLQTQKAGEKDKLLKRVMAGDANPDDFGKPVTHGLTRDSLLRIQTVANLKNQLYQNNKEMYIDLDFEDDFQNSELKKDRKVPYKFNTRMFKKLRTELTVPTGYQLASLPERLSIKSPYYEFEMGYQFDNDKIIYTKEIRILQNTLPVSEFSQWNNAIHEVKNFYNNQITLKAK